jgi:hypothetical protein
MGGVQRQGPPLQTCDESHAWLQSRIASGVVFMAGYLSTLELELLLYYAVKRSGDERHPYPLRLQEESLDTSQLFPNNETTLDEWAQYVLSVVLPNMDAVAEDTTRLPLYEMHLLNKYVGSSAVRMTSQAVQVDAKWRPPQRIALVSPTVSLEGDVYSVRITGPPWPAAFASWRTALRYMYDCVISSGARLAIVDCGLLTLPLMMSLKLNGISVVRGTEEKIEAVGDA